MELLLHSLPEWVVPHVACPRDDPYWSRFSGLVNGRMFRIPHRRFSISDALRLSQYVRDSGIRVAHAHGKGAGAYARFVSASTGIFGVHTAHGVHVGSYGPLTKKIYVAYENVTACWVNHVIHVSREEQVQAGELGLWSTVPSSVIANGVQEHVAATGQVWREAARRRLGIPDGLPVVATISRFDFQKNMQEAYAIAKATPGMLFLWIGAGSDADALQAQAVNESVSNVRFLGNMDTPLEALAAADLYLSTSRWEGLPLAVLEAMSLGIPSVLSDVTGHNDLVERHAVGLLYQLGDVATAASHLNRLAESRALRENLSDQARAVQQREFSSCAVAQQVSAVYASLVNE